MIVNGVKLYFDTADFWNIYFCVPYRKGSYTGVKLGCVKDDRFVLAELSTTEYKCRNVQLVFYILHGLFFRLWKLHNGFLMKTSQWLFNVLITSTEINSSYPPLKHCAIITFTWRPLTTENSWHYRIMLIISKQHSQHLHSKNIPKGVNTLLIDQRFIVIFFKDRSIIVIIQLNE